MAQVTGLPPGSTFAPSGGSLPDQLKALADARRLSDEFRGSLDKTRASADQLRGSLRAGSAAFTPPSKVFELRQELARVAEAQRRYDLTRQYGQLGASLVLAGEKAQLLSRRLEAVGRVGAYAYGLVAVSAYGMARQGLAGTVEGAQLAYQWQLLAREAANLFVPAVRAVTDWLARLNGVMRGLSGEQQQHIRRWGLMVAGAGAFALLLPRIAGGVGSVLGVLGRLAPLLGSLGPALGLGGLGAVGGPVGLAVAGALVLAAAGFAVAYARSAEFRAEVGKLGAQLYRLYEQAKPFVDLALDGVVNNMTLGVRLLNVQLQQMTTNLRAAERAWRSLPSSVRRTAELMARGALGGGGDRDGGGGGRGRDDVTLNQTGVETAEGTFQRIQQAILVYESNTKSADEQTAENTKQSAEYLANIWQATQAGGLNGGGNRPLASGEARRGGG